jgi:hypothetical protein
MSTLIHERVKLAKRGMSPPVICRLRSGWGGPVFNYPKAERESRPFDPARDDRLLRSLREFLETSGYALPRDDLR